VLLEQLITRGRGEKQKARKEQERKDTVEVESVGVVEGSCAKRSFTLYIQTTILYNQIYIMGAL
jgi:hypothetical protein